MCSLFVYIGFNLASEVLTWGSNEHGQLGHGELKSICWTPRRVAQFRNVSACLIAASRTHSLVVIGPNRGASVEATKRRNAYALLAPGAKEKVFCLFFVFVFLFWRYLLDETLIF